MDQRRLSALLTNAQNYESYIIFVVRDDSRRAATLPAERNTYQAYGNYPDDGTTGKSLYEYNSYGANTVTGTTGLPKAPSIGPTLVWCGPLRALAGAFGL